MFFKMTEKENEILQNLIRGLKTDSPLVLEIGCWVGKTSCLFANELKKCNGKLVCVDWWKGDECLGMLAEQNNIYDLFVKNIKKEKCQNEIIVFSSDVNDVLKLFKPEMFDLIFIDGGHTYEQTKKDIFNCKRILKNDGILCGHDFGCQFPGVEKAVCEMVDEFNLIERIWIKGV